MKQSYEDIINYRWNGSPGRIRMPLEQRAKIFMAFTPLTGYSELLRKAEEVARSRFDNHHNTEENF